MRLRNRIKLETTLKKANWFEDNESTVHLLDSFTRFVGRVTKTSNVEDFWSILYFSWSVTSVAGLNEILEEDQVRYLSKLGDYVRIRSEEHTSELQSLAYLVCRLLLEKKKTTLKYYEIKTLHTSQVHDR